MIVWLLVCLICADLFLLLLLSLCVRCLCFVCVRLSVHVMFDVCCFVCVFVCVCLFMVVFGLFRWFFFRHARLRPESKPLCLCIRGCLFLLCDCVFVCVSVSVVLCWLRVCVCLLSYAV